MCVDYPRFTQRTVFHEIVAAAAPRTERFLQHEIHGLQTNYWRGVEDRLARLSERDAKTSNTTRGGGDFTI